MMAIYRIQTQSQIEEAVELVTRYGFKDIEIRNSRGGNSYIATGLLKLSIKKK